MLRMSLMIGRQHHLHGAHQAKVLQWLHTCSLAPRMPRQHRRPNIKGPAAPKLPTFRSKFAKAQREGGVVVQVTWGDLIKTVHVSTKHCRRKVRGTASAPWWQAYLRVCYAPHLASIGPKDWCSGRSASLCFPIPLRRSEEHQLRLLRSTPPSANLR